MTDPPPSSPGVTVPPPVLYVVGFLAGVVLEAVASTPDPPLPVAILVGIAGLVVWVLLDPGAMREFSRAGTEVAPSRASTTVVTTGPYRWTRNPMYLGMAVLHAALAAAFGVLWALLTLVVVMVVIDRLVVAREERYLRSAFGQQYADYQQRVRRWL